MNKLVISWLYSKSIINIPFLYVLIFCVFYNIQYNTIYDAK